MDYFKGDIMNKIQSLSSKMRLLFQILFFLAPLFMMLYWTFYEFFTSISINWFNFGLQNELLTINNTSKSFAILISFIPTGIIMFGLFKLQKLFSNYTKNIVFSEENVALYRQLGLTFFALVLGNIVTT